ncbi:MAG: aminotransferase class I/II-fold pyridoxal phosphate-dependent enzyme [Candidatus Omnitrophota bacterium]
MKISQTVEKMAPSGIRAFFDLVLTMKDVISLGVGEPDFVTPWRIREKAIYSLEKGYTSYTSNQGMPELRKQLAVYLRHRHGLDYDDKKEILITVGVSEGMDLVVRALLNPGDKVLIPEPHYVSYGPIVEMAGGQPIFIQTHLQDGFKLKPKQIEKAYHRGVKAIILNYPCNPTGTSYTKEELKELSRIILKHNLLVISDEIYDELTYDFDHVPLSTLKGMKKNVIYLNGFSKAFAMTGFRIGWACGPEEIIAAMTKIHQYTMMCVPITSQLAGIEALKSGFRDVQDMKKEYVRRRRYITTSLNELGLDCPMPQGTFYVFPSIKKTKMKSMDFATDLLNKKRVALVPGVAFGPSGEGHVRISYASSYDNLKEAVSRLRQYLGKI